MEFKFCPCCATPLSKNKEKKLFCNTEKNGCGWIFYNNPLPVVASLIVFPKKYIITQPKVEQEYDLDYKDFSETGILLVQRGVNPHKGEWCLPCGYIDSYETPRSAGKRETFEESGFRVELEKLLYACNPVPGKLNQILISFLGYPISGFLNPGDDALDARIFSNSEMPKVCFSAHEDIINKWYKGEFGRISKNARAGTFI